MIFFFNNCATKIRDLIGENGLISGIQINQATDLKKTFRDLLSENLAAKQLGFIWYKFSIRGQSRQNSGPKRISILTNLSLRIIGNSHNSWLTPCRK